MKNNSIWLENLDYKPSRKLNKNKNVDVLIIGGGITGLSIAYHLMDSKLNVCLVEKNKIGHGVTARTTGKLTFLQELIYTKLKKYHSKETSKLYLESQIDAIKIVEDIINKHNIDCDFSKVKSYVFTNDIKELNNIYEEYKLLKEFNVNIKESKKINDNINCKKCIYVENTYVFHPLKYLIGLKKIIEKNISIYENTTIFDIKKENDLYVCNAGKNKIAAKHIVIATHYPFFLIPYLFPLKCHLEKSYICAYKINKPFYFSAITSNTPTISIRSHSDIKNSYQIYLSNSHNLCNSNNERKNFNDLLDKVDIKPDYMWSNKDIISSDYLPHIGSIKNNMYIATSYNTWGMTNSSIAGVIISDIIKGRNNKYIELFDPKRPINIGKIVNFPSDISSNIKSFVSSKINPNKSWYKEKIEFKKINGEQVGIYTDKDNKKHIVYNKCPHMKCGLIFNEVEKTWDCPCHGSRFDTDGICIEGPSNYNISYKE